MGSISAGGGDEDDVALSGAKPTGLGGRFRFFKNGKCLPMERDGVLYSAPLTNKVWENAECEVGNDFEMVSDDSKHKRHLPLFRSESVLSPCITIFKVFLWSVSAFASAVTRSMSHIETFAESSPAIARTTTRRDNVDEAHRDPNEGVTISKSSHSVTLILTEHGSAREVRQGSQRWQRPLEHVAVVDVSASLSKLGLGITLRRSIGLQKGRQLSILPVDAPVIRVTLPASG
ncbi:hypothetical protein M422DRAFT_247303 [Sphaerobolus stellatus SS14]|nr:hypothetical protein M422DRAFT_247298 [Sphaerobolus stellatus SS14]KIJ48928.1 hypothetical protein M422DRAFT_247303 [Sphaerobolus stellatus SS14]